MTVFLELLALAILILLNGFFVGAEYGLVTSRRTRIMELEHQGNRRARDVLRITSDPPRFISAMQLGVTITSLAIGALVVIWAGLRSVGLDIVDYIRSSVTGG